MTTECKLLRLGPVVELERRLEVWICKDAGFSLSGCEKDLLAAPAEGTLVGLARLLMRCHGRGLSW